MELSIGQLSSDQCRCLFRIGNLSQKATVKEEAATVCKRQLKMKKKETENKVQNFSQENTRSPVTDMKVKLKSFNTL